MKDLPDLTYSYVVTVVNVVTKEVRAIWFDHGERLSEIEDCLDDDEAMFVNDLRDLWMHDRSEE